MAGLPPSPSAAAGRLLAIGDIHGCRLPLRDLLAQVAPTAADQLVFLGDYVDRGPDSAGVIEDLLELRARLPRTVFLCGNHEQMLLDVLAGGDPSTFLLNGGTQTIVSYRAHGGWPPPPAHCEFLHGLAISFETDEFIFVHAGLRPRIPLERQDPDDLLWIRAEFLQAEADWGKAVVYGHTPATDVLLGKDRLGLDTGCVFGGRLTCCDVLTRRYWQSRC
jgi:serine/threonine protein phosphatase 1